MELANAWHDEHEYAEAEAQLLSGSSSTGFQLLVANQKVSETPPFGFVDMLNRIFGT